MGGKDTVTWQAMCRVDQQLLRDVTLLFSGQFFELSHRKNRTVLADILVSEVAAAAYPDTAFHALFQGKDDPLRGEL